MKPITREPTFYLLLLLLLFLVGVDLYYAQLYHYNVIDDAYISFQYAKNLILGNGLVFNPGERVEGYTNFLWIVFLAPIYFLSTLLHFDFTTAAIFLNVALALVDVVILYRISRRIFQNDWIAVSFVLLFTVLDNSFQVYAMSGMENHLVILWMLLSIDLSLKETRCQPYWLGLVFALACMTRPDAGLFVGAYFLTRRFHWRTLGFFCFVFGVYFIWRYFYYGDILPNTYHLKVGKGLGALTRGWEYTKSFFEDRYYLPLLSITALFGISQPLIRWLLVFLLLQIAYVTYVGGDFYTGQRFYLVLIPIMALLMGTSLQHFSLWLKQWERGGDWRVLPAIWLSLWFIFFVMRGYPVARTHFDETQRAGIHRASGRFHGRW
ncbi:MAG: hypothetical protein HY073_02730 [Deltaproteobacteria bacterium]|nr:hypothetical protein [Deltaproteobacteria bacterium]